jgi:hypothetical protein
MKRYRTYAITLLMVLFSDQILSAQENGPGKTTIDSLGVVLIPFGFILILLGLALWFSYSSSKLDKSIKGNELNGKEWLEEHLNDLNEEQLDFLVKNLQDTKGKHKDTN